jgi:hypothetical protein
MSIRNTLFAGLLSLGLVAARELVPLKPPTDGKRSTDPASLDLKSEATFYWGDVGKCDLLRR